MSLVQTIRLHRACNQGCTFCTLRDSRPHATPTAEVERRLAEGLVGQSSIVRFTGGEPTLDRRLPGYIRIARDLGYEHVEIETNATVASVPGYADSLVDAGLTRAWVTLLSADEARSDEISRDPGGFARTWAGLRALVERGVRIGLLLPVALETADELAPLVDAVVSALGAAVDGVRLFMVTDGEHPAPYSAVEAAVGRTAARCRKHRLDHRFEAAYCPPPCGFSDRFVRIHTALFSSLRVVKNGTDGDRERIEACGSCGLSERCAGYPQKLAERLPGSVPTAPPGEEAVAAVRGQLPGVDRARRVQLTVVQAPETPWAGDEPNLRLNWACNQRCRFCWIDFDWTPPTREQVLLQVAQLRKQGALSLNLTGGEPTLVPWLPDVVRAARECGFARIELQTNAVHLSEGDLLARLVDAGLTRTLVSLHSHDAAVNDAVTQAEGYFVRTVAALDRLVEETDLEILVNHVITGRNLATTAGFPAFVHERWGARVTIVWSAAAAITEAALRYDDGVVPFDLVGPALREALERCVELGVPFSGQDGACGVPPCVLLGDERFVARGFSSGHGDSESYAFVDECEGCSHRGICRGMQRAYVARFGGRGVTRLSHPPRVQVGGSAWQP